ncbi:probable G-protein coupled receptor Mth-like 12 [Gigantopelta aegis]|uniref:probable G-protein coupled receptor Mth-like 12 n=1 Tax=Gigantopelta aegis TaxID=1735272 RepID=UPI001B889BAD|nr:probable G-protein coupled receptor Mth-like 12 [Gigantopelta aegis]
MAVILQIKYDVVALDVYVSISTVLMDVLAAVTVIAVLCNAVAQDDEYSSNRTLQFNDTSTDTCRWLSCPRGRYLLEGDCVYTEYNITEIEYWFEAAFTLPISNGTKQYTNQSLENMVFGSLSRLFSREQVRLFEVQIKTYVSRYTLLETVSVRCAFLPLVNLNRTVFEETMTSSIFQDWYLHTNHTVFSLRPENYDSKDVMNTTRTRIYILDPETGECCRPLSNDTKPSDMDVDLITGRLTNVVLTHVPYCPYVRLNHTDFTLTDDVVSLLFADVKLTNGTYVIQQSDLLVCRDLVVDLYQSATSKPEPTIGPIPFLVCTCISLFCLALTFITFCTFSELRTLPTKNNMFLVISLFLAQGILQFSSLLTFNKLLCSVVGLIIHLFWLTVFLWMNVCSFHMFYIFVISKVLMVNSRSPKWLLRRYVIYVYSKAILLVISNMLVNAAFGTEVGYGGPYCYLWPGDATSIAMVVPIVLILSANVVFLVKTILGISKVKEMKRESGSERNNIFVYLKLSSLTGVVWLLAIMTMVIAYSPLKYVTIVLSTCQGVFIFFSYVANYRTLARWASLCGVPLKEHSRTSTSV